MRHFLHSCLANSCCLELSVIPFTPLIQAVTLIYTFFFPADLLFYLFTVFLSLLFHCLLNPPPLHLSIAFCHSTSVSYPLYLSYLVCLCRCLSLINVPSLSVTASFSPLFVVVCLSHSFFSPFFFFTLSFTLLYIHSIIFYISVGLAFISPSSVCVT